MSNALLDYVRTQSFSVGEDEDGVEPVIVVHTFKVPPQFKSHFVPHEEGFSLDSSAIAMALGVSLPRARSIIQEFISADNSQHQSQQPPPPPDPLPPPAPAKEEHLLRVRLPQELMTQYGPFFERVTTDSNGCIGLIGMHGLASLLGVPFNKCVEIVLHEKLDVGGPVVDNQGGKGKTAAMDLYRMLSAAQQHKTKTTPTQPNQALSHTNSDTPLEHLTTPPFRAAISETEAPKRSRVGGFQMPSFPSIFKSSAHDAHQFSSPTESPLSPTVPPPAFTPPPTFTATPATPQSPQSPHSQHPQKPARMQRNHTIHGALAHAHAHNNEFDDEGNFAATVNPAPDMYEDDEPPPRKGLLRYHSTPITPVVQPKSVSPHHSSNHNHHAPAPSSTKLAMSPTRSAANRAASPSRIAAVVARSASPSRTASQALALSGAATRGRAPSRPNPTPLRSRTPSRSSFNSPTTEDGAPVPPAATARQRSSVGRAPPVPLGKTLSGSLARASSGGNPALRTSSGNPVSPKETTRKLSLPSPNSNPLRRSNTDGSDASGAAAATGVGASSPGTLKLTDVDSVRVRVWGVFCELVCSRDRGCGWTDVEVSISMRIPSTVDKFAVTCMPSVLDRNLQTLPLDSSGRLPSDPRTALAHTLVVGMDGCASLSPSQHSTHGCLSWDAHAAVYASRADVSAVVVAYSMFASMVACTRETMPLFHACMRELSGTADRKVICCGSVEGGRFATVGQALGLNAVALLHNMGQIAVGIGADGCDQAMRNAIKFERACEMFWRMKSSGGN